MSKRQRSIFDYLSTKIKDNVPKEEKIEDQIQQMEEMFCPICNFDLTKFTVDARSVHVNRCIDIPVGKEQLNSPTKRRKITKVETIKESSDILQETNEEIKIEETTMRTLIKEETQISCMETTILPQDNLSIAKPTKPRKKRLCKPKPPISEEKILIFPKRNEEERDNILAVDAFCYSPDVRIKTYLLTHFHSDHYSGLCKSWDNGDLIICTPITSRLVILKFNYPRENLFILEEYEKSYRIPDTDIDITAFDANHCPGAGIFVIECNGLKYLHCGDFRANTTMITKLNENYPGGFDRCYLDTTYFDPTYTFPKQDDVVRIASSWIKKKCEIHKSKQQRVVDFFTNNGGKTQEFLIVVGTYSIGKEKLALGITKALETKILCTKDKYKILKQYGWGELEELLQVDNGLNCGVHLVPMSKTRKDNMVEYLKQYSAKYKAILVVIPTGWTFGYGKKGESDSSGSSENLSDEAIEESFERGFNVGSKKLGLVTVRKIQVPYSEHSSYSELVEFIGRVPVRRWVPTVGVKSGAEQVRRIAEVAAATRRRA